MARAGGAPTIHTSSNAMRSDKKSRYACFTYYGTNEPARLCEDTVKYLVWQWEICPDTGRRHAQGYAEFKNALSIKSIQNKLNCPGAHIEERRGTAEQASEYCKKKDSAEVPGEYHESGTISKAPAPGKRNDLLILKEKAESGASIAEMFRDDECFGHMLKYSGAMQTYIDLLNQKKRDFKTQGWWFYGKTMTGKTHRSYALCEEILESKFGITEGWEEEVYNFVASDQNWWDKYTGQKCVVMNDFRGNQIQYAELLKLVDKWPHSVRRRNTSPREFVAHVLIINSPFSPGQAYEGMLHTEDKITQLERRFSSSDNPEDYGNQIIECTHRTDQEAPAPPLAPIFNPDPQRALAIKQQIRQGKRKAVIDIEDEDI